jgi:hypothetical protein
VWIAVDQGTFLFRGDSWQPVTYHWGPTPSIVAGKFLFQQNARWSPAQSPTNSISFGHPSLSVRNAVPSFDGRAVFSALYQDVPTDPDPILDIGVFVFPPDGSGAPPDFYPRNSNLELGYATYFGSNGNDSAVSLGISKNGSREVVVSAVNFGGAQLIVSNSSYHFQSLPQTAASSRGHLIFRNSSVASTLLRVVRVATSIDHMAISRSPSPRIVLAADGSVTVLDSVANSILWTFGIDGMRFFRVSIASDGTVGALCFKITDTFRKQLLVLSPTGVVIGSLDVGINLLSDVAITSDYGGIVWIAGQEQVDVLLRKPYLRAFVTTANLPPLFTMFPYSATQLTDSVNTASSRITQLHYGADGKLYILGDSGGGNTVFRYNGYDLSTVTTKGLDDYTVGWNVGPSRILYYARVSPVTGIIETSQFRLTRQVQDYLAGEMPTDAAAISANSRGDVFLAGVMQCCSPGQRFHRVNCQRTQPTQSGYHNYVIGLTRNLTRVMFWNSLNKGGGTGSARGIVVGQDAIYTLLESAFPEGSRDSDRLFTTPNADFTSRVGSGTDNDLWYSAFTPKAENISSCDAQALSELLGYNDPDAPQRYPFSTFQSPAPMTSSSPTAAQSPGIEAVAVAASSVGVIVGVIIAVVIVAGVVILVVVKRDLIRTVAKRFNN